MKRFEDVGYHNCTYFVHNILIVTNEILKIDVGVPGVTLDVQAAAAQLRFPVSGHGQAVSAGRMDK